MAATAGRLFGALIASACVTATLAGASPAAPKRCPMSSFVLRLGPYVSEATGQHTLALRLVNRSGSSCVLDGYPDVRLSDRLGLVPFVIRHGGDQMITSHRPMPVVVPPRRAAVVALNHYRCDRGGLRAATRVQMRFADRRQTGTASVTITDPYRTPDYCGAGDAGSILTVSPFESTLQAALGG